MAHSNATKNAVRTAYTQGADLTVAANQQGVAYQTARNWKAKAKREGDDWDTARAAYKLSASGINDLTSSLIHDFIYLFSAVMDQIKNDKELPAKDKADMLAKLSDSYNKTVKGAKQSSSQLSALSVALDVLKRLTVFIEKNYPELKADFAELLGPFAKEIAKFYGNRKAND